MQRAVPTSGGGKNLAVPVVALVTVYSPVTMTGVVTFDNQLVGGRLVAYSRTKPDGLVGQVSLLWFPARLAPSEGRIVFRMVTILRRPLSQCLRCSLRTPSLGVSAGKQRRLPFPRTNF